MMLSRSRRIVTILALPVALGAQGVTPPTLVVDHVSVIDVEGGRTLSDQRVVISGRRITAVGAAASTAAPARATIVDGRGKFLMPGMWDMHIHVSGDPTKPQYAFPLLLANGITGIRDMGFGVDGLIFFRKEVAEGRILGPRILGAGVLVDGAPHVYPAAITLEVTTPEAARHAVDSLKARGVNFIKAYEMLKPDVYLALADQAKKDGLPIGGHLPLQVTAQQAINAGMHSFEHLRNWNVACSTKADSLIAVATAMIERGKDTPGMALRASIHAAIHPTAFDTFDAAKCDALISAAVQHDAWETPTLGLNVQRAFGFDTTERFQKWVPYLADSMSVSWKRTAQTTPPTAAQIAARDENMKRAEYFFSLVRRMKAAGTRFLAGTDFPIPVMIPGVGVHEELALFVRAGFTNADALRTATLNPAIYLGLADSVGTVAPGKVAELVLLDGNPLDDIRNVSRVQAVWRAGRYLDRNAIDAMLADLKRAVSMPR